MLYELHKRSTEPKKMFYNELQQALYGASKTLYNKLHKALNDEPKIKMLYEAKNNNALWQL